MAAAIVSLLTNRPALRDVAMTGEISLSGRVLAIGGLKEKILAARRAGVKKIVVPARNQVDMSEISAAVKGDMEIVFVEDVREAVAHIM
jgi:ATP-dependent Lon protease